MYERRWPYVAAGVVGIIVVALIGWAAGRATAPDSAAEARDTGDKGGAVRLVDGVPIGVERSRAGALAAADNYVAVSSDTVVQDPQRYERLVREAYAAGYQGKALRDGVAAREDAPQSIRLYESGGKSLSIVGARRLDSYEGRRARTTTWVGGITWGPGRVPGHTWSLVESSLVWARDRWRVTKLDVVERPAPAPRRLGYGSSDQLETATFDRELRGMTAPTYGAR